MRHITLSLIILFSFNIFCFSQEKSISDLRKQAAKLQKDGNWKDAFQVYESLLLERADTGQGGADDLKNAWVCLSRMRQSKLVDDLLEKVVEKYPEDWRILVSAARVYNQIPKWGMMIDDEFIRESRSGGGKRVNTRERDRVRSLSLMEQALNVSADEEDKKALGTFYFEFAAAIGRGGNEAWRLQDLTDLTKLPDYHEGGYYSARNVGTPVDAEGAPVYYEVSPSWKEAKNDGERWRFLLTEVAEIDSARTAEAKYQWIRFIKGQFGVQTMRSWGGGRFFGGHSPEEGKENESGTYELHTLDETETIARLATGIKRIKLPDEHNHIKLLKQVASLDDKKYPENALNDLASIFEDRRQYPKAAKHWQQSIEKFGPGNNGWKVNRLNQILDNWGRFDGTQTHPAGENPSVGFVFRNGEEVKLEAYTIDVRKLLDDVKAHLKSNPAKLDHQQISISNIGYSLVNDRMKKYVGEMVSDWEQRLEPRKNHWDKRIDIVTPLTKPGAYLLKAKMTDGNVSHIIIWVSDTAIVKKPLNEKSFYFVGDALNGNPVDKANVEFFGYRVEYLPKPKLLQPNRRYNVITKQFAEFTDENGQIILGADRMPNQMQWLVTATSDDGRFAYHGFSGVWYNKIYDPAYKMTKAIFITDRPVYRPKQEVHFKAWIRHAQYDKSDDSQFAGQKFKIFINNPKGEKIYEKSLEADDYGGISDKIMLPEDSTLGVYNIYVDRRQRNPFSIGGNSFRVEEYKKPEFEVSIEAPSEPVMLGEKVPAKVTAKYLFGAPVQNATVKYKVMRSEHDSRWFAPMPWDWFYGTGYWWFAYDYNWYPGWRDWGCRRPNYWWWPRNNMPPEVVLENEVEIGPDGTVEIEIDTAIAKAIHGDIDHKYSITAEVRDESRRTIVGSGSVLVARKPFKVNVWLDRGHYRVGDVIKVNANSRTLDGKSVAGEGTLKLIKIEYDDDGNPVEKPISTWDIDPNGQGLIEHQIKASAKGQYRVSYNLKDKAGHKIEGGYVFVVRGEGFDGKEFRFNDIEIITDKKEYKPGEIIELMINTERENSTVALFVRPTNGVYLKPKIINIKGKSTVAEIKVTQKDMPNFFLEAFTISGGKIYEDTREVIVPPQKRILNVEVLPSETRYKPGAPAKVKVRLTDLEGEPFVGSTVVTVYDKALEYISGGSNVPEIKEFFWKWRRSHNRNTEFNLNRWFNNVYLKGKKGMNNIGAFGASVADDPFAADLRLSLNTSGKFLSDNALERFSARDGKARRMLAKSAPEAATFGSVEADFADGAIAFADAEGVGAGGEGALDQSGSAPGAEVVQPVVRSNFADLAFWASQLNTDKNGIAEVEIDMPENLTTWKIKTWAMGQGTKVGHGEAEVITSKDLLIRMQAPRFFVEKDQVTLSANVHNYLKNDKDVKVEINLEGNSLEVMKNEKASKTITIEAGGEKRVDWLVKAVREGEASITMKALTDEESDAMQMSYPVLVHGMLKTESFSGALSSDQKKGVIKLKVPAERRPEQTRLEVRYSPSLATAMVDALPYLVDYPYGCTEQTLNRFIPTVITQKILLNMGIDLKDVKKKRTNLNAQEIGKDKKRAKQWKRGDNNPVFDDKEVEKMVKSGVERLTSMQNSDGGWGWFYGPQERSWSHTTAVVVHGLQLAVKNDVALVPGTLAKGVKWLESYQNNQVRLIMNAEDKFKNKKWKEKADNLDAFVFMVLCDAEKVNAEMADFLYRDRNDLSVYSKSMLGLAMHKINRVEERDMLIQNVEQFLVIDEENQSAYLDLRNGGYWWYWYGSEFEAQAYYLKLLSAVKPDSPQASGLAKYLINNRKNATYWNSTRDTAICIEALADYIKATGENEPDLEVEVVLNGKVLKEVKINKKNLFNFDNKLVLEGDAVDTGDHKLEFRKKGKGPLYFNAYLTNFTLEDFITKAGLEVKVNRSYFKLVPEDKSVKNVGSRGQSVDQKVEKFKKIRMASGDEIKSGDIVEIELIIESKNDYEYLMFEDMKAAGFEPVDLRSGYTRNGMGAYMELRDQKVTFFVRSLPRGKHSISYKMRAETPGKFSALPSRAEAMYAPELRANSDEIKISITE